MSIEGLPRRVGRRGLALLVALALAVGACGFALAALTVTSAAMTASGASVNTTGLAHWYQVQAQTATIPTTVPTQVSSTVGTPTVLPYASTNYTINSATAGDPAVVFVVHETSGLAARTELELTFSISVGGSPATSTVKAYVESQAMAMPLTFGFFFDTGTISIAHATITSVQLTNQACSAVGTCP